MEQIIDFTRYGNTEHDLALRHTNDMVDAINKTWNEHYAKTMMGSRILNFFIYVGLKLMAYKSHQGHIFTNSEELEINHGLTAH